MVTMVTIGLPLGNCDISYKWSEVYTPDSSPVYCLTCTSFFAIAEDTQMEKVFAITALR